MGHYIHSRSGMGRTVSSVLVLAVAGSDMVGVTTIRHRKN